MRYFAAILLMVIALMTTGLATNTYILNGAVTAYVPNTYGWSTSIDGSNEIRFVGDGNYVSQESNSPTGGSGIYQTSKNRIDVIGTGNNIMQKNWFSAANAADPYVGGTIEQDLYNYAYVRGDSNHVAQENDAVATIASGSFDAFIDQTATNLAYIGKGDVSSNNYLMQLNAEEAKILSSPACVDAMIIQNSKNVGTQEGNSNQLYQGPQDSSSVGSNYARATINGVRTNYDTIEQTQSNTAMQRGSNNKAFQQNTAISDILDYDYNTITQTQKNSLTQDGNWNVMNQGLYQGNGVGSNWAKAYIATSCKTEINQEQSSRGNQVGSNTESTALNMVQGAHADAKIINAAWEYLALSASIDQNQKLIGTQGGSSNNLYQNVNTATAEIKNSAGSDIAQSQMSRGGQGGSNNRMTQSNEATGILHYGRDQDDIHITSVVDRYGDLKGNVIEQIQRNNGEQAVSSYNVLTQENHAGSVNYDGEPGMDSMYKNGVDEHSVQIQTNDARENHGYTADASGLIITQKNQGNVEMYGVKDETKLNSANVAMWTGTNDHGSKIEQTLIVDSASDPVRYDWNADIIEVTAKNICQMRIDPAETVTMYHDISGTDYSGENPITKNIRWLNIDGTDIA